MFINTQKEEFSYAYISAVASTAGYSFQNALRTLMQQIANRELI
jgi:hypothetical protein